MKLGVLLDRLGVPADGVPAGELEREVEVEVGAYRFDVFQVVTKVEGPIRLTLITTAA